MININELRERVTSQRHAILLDHRRGTAGGREVVARLTALADTTIRDILNQALKKNPAAITKQPFAIVGIGGYGRKELCPCSDIDLLTLHEKDIGHSAESAANILVPALWDIGFEVGHAIRGIRETIQMSKNDMTVKTNLIESRMIWGNEFLYLKFRGVQWENTVRKNIEPFLRHLEVMRAKMTERPLGIAQPNIKLDRGGLRMLQTSLWAAYARFGIYEPESLHQRGILTGRDLDCLKRSLDFLYRIRNELHFRENKKNDTLAFEVQAEVAGVLGYQGDTHVKVKNFMRDYYLHVSRLEEISNGLFHHSRNYRKGLFKRTGRLFCKRIGRNVTLMGREIFFSGDHPEALKEDPESVLDILSLCQDKGYRMNQVLKKMLRKAMLRVNKNFFSGRIFQEFFMAALQKRGSSKILRMMHEIGALGGFLPEFDAITHSTPYDFYHAYTIDEHTFQALSHLEALEEKKEGILSDIYKSGEMQWLVKLVILLHDIGKSEEDTNQTHSQISARIACGTCEKLGLSEPMTELVVFLIKHHLILNFIARRRDTHDPKTIRDLAYTLQTRRRLDMLYLITYADMMGVAPGVWSNWFSFLLEGLYERTADFMNIDESDRPGDEEKVAAIKKKVLKYLPREISGNRAMAYMDSAPIRYLASTPFQNIIEHIFLSSTMGEKKPAVSINDEGLNFTEMVLFSESHRGNLNRVAGVLASLGISILETRIFRRNNGTSIDIFRFIDRYGKPVRDKEQINRIEKEIIRVMESRKPPGKGELKKILRPTGTLIYPRVEIRNDVSPTHTVIEIEAADRIGLIQSVTYAIFKMGLNIHLAKIDTEGNRAIDALYVTDVKDRPLLDENLLRELKSALMEVL